MKIDLYQDSRECYFWTKDELGYLEEKYPDAFTFKSPTEPIWYRGYELRVQRGKKYNIVNDGVGNTDCVIIVFEYSAQHSDQFKQYLELIENNPETKFIFVAKNVEDYWLVNDIRSSDELLIRMSNYNNLKVIWDVDGVEYKNFYFEPKVNLQNYYNNGTFPGFMFINGGGIFHNLKKEYRMGIHLNKITDSVRNHLYNQYKDNKTPTLFFTSKHDKKDAIFVNQIKGMSNNGVTTDWYSEQFVELTIKSQMEVIYETFTTISEYRWLLKWNEKTIKQLFLSKPFIHADPAAHSLFKANGLKGYRSLYTDELWELYEGYDNQQLLKLNHSESEFFWREALDRNIEWLLTMDTTEWNWRINEANELAIQNRAVIEGYIFNQSLLKYVE